MSPRIPALNLALSGLCKTLATARPHPILPPSYNVAVEISMAPRPPRGHLTDSPDNGARLLCSTFSKLWLYNERGGYEGHFWLSEDNGSTVRRASLYENSGIKNTDAENRLEVSPSKLFSTYWFKKKCQKRKSGADDVYGRTEERK